MSMVHPMARTTPRTRAEIHDSAASVAELAQAYNISSSTARKWRNRDDLLDRSHKAHQLHTTLSPAQELIVMEIRRLCLLPLDDLVAAVKAQLATANAQTRARLAHRFACVSGSLDARGARLKQAADLVKQARL